MSPRRAVLFAVTLLAAVACRSPDDDGPCGGCGGGTPHSLGGYTSEFSSAQGTVTLRWALGEETFTIATSETEPVEVFSDVARDWLADGGLAEDAGDAGDDAGDAGVDEDARVDAGGASAEPVGEPVGTKEGRIAVVSFGRQTAGTFNLDAAGAMVIRCEHPFEELVGGVSDGYACRSAVVRPATVERLAGSGHLSAPTDAGLSTFTELHINGTTPSGTRVVLSRRSTSTTQPPSTECL